MHTRHETRDTCCEYLLGMLGMLGWQLAEVEVEVEFGLRAERKSSNTGTGSSCMRVSRLPRSRPGRCPRPSWLEQRPALLPPAAPGLPCSHPCAPHGLQLAGATWECTEYGTTSRILRNGAAIRRPGAGRSERSGCSGAQPAGDSTANAGGHEARSGLALGLDHRCANTQAMRARLRMPDTYMWRCGSGRWGREHENRRQRRLRSDDPPKCLTRLTSAALQDVSYDSCRTVRHAGT